MCPVSSHAVAGSGTGRMLGSQVRAPARAALLKKMSWSAIQCGPHLLQAEEDQVQHGRELRSAHHTQPAPSDNAR
jgi:hypothetical protein